MSSISLSDLTSRISETISLNFQKPVWIRAEINELRENAGHCYMELVEKADDSDQMLAKCRATCWASTYRMLKTYFESSTGQSLRAGLKVLIAVTVEFHGVYGFNLIVRDIDPVFTIGEMAARRLQIIRQLEADGIAEMNKQLPMSVPAQRIAVISSPTAAGYEDFCNQLKDNRYGYVFYVKLFPAIMQGDKTEESVINALDRIFECVDLFDVVVIIRGGGASADLAAFDSYLLAANCAQFPLPLISGIGHQRDLSIVDLVAHTSLKTPTAVAEFLISALEQAEAQAADVFLEIANVVRYRLRKESQELDEKRMQVKHILKEKISRKAYQLAEQKQRLRSALRVQLLKQHNKLSLIEKAVEAHSPAFLLQHGYTITTLNGKRITSVHGVKPGDCVKTHLVDGNFESEVGKTKLRIKS